MGINIRFCQILLATVLKSLTDIERTSYRKNAAVICTDNSPGRKQYLFEWPYMRADDKKFIWEGSADNAYDARAQALNDWVDHHAPSWRTRVSKT